MLNSILIDETTNAVELTAGDFLVCTLVSICLGLLIAAAYMLTNKTCQKGFVITVALLPMIVEMIIMIVNGNLGTGIAVMGAFSLVRFRSIPGKAQEILTIFLAMAVGLATGTGYLAVAALFVGIACGLNILLSYTKFGGPLENHDRTLVITVPESLNETNAFNEAFANYTDKAKLMRVKTTNLGSLYKLEYTVRLKHPEDTKAFIDELRTRNGNLEISLGYASSKGDVL